MKIEQIQAVVNDRGHTQIFGMGVDGLMYRWSYQNAEWELYKITEKLQKE
jgi:hypothetical protein